MTQKAALSENRVLVVDDDASTTLLLKKVLETENYQVDTANSAAVAMSLINKQKYHVVITDIMMPDKDGLALLEDLRAQMTDAEFDGALGMVIDEIYAGSVA